MCQVGRKTRSFTCGHSLVVTHLWSVLIILCIGRLSLVVSWCELVPGSFKKARCSVSPLQVVAVMFDHSAGAGQIEYHRGHMHTDTHTHRHTLNDH